MFALAFAAILAIQGPAPKTLTVHRGTPFEVGRSVQLNYDIALVPPIAVNPALVGGWQGTMSGVGWSKDYRLFLLPNGTYTMYIWNLPTRGFTLHTFNERPNAILNSTLDSGDALTWLVGIR